MNPPATRRASRRVFTQARDLRALVLVAVIFSAFAVPVSAYHRDSHYHLRFALALSTCFDWSEAHLVASGDWMLDENSSTVAEMHPMKRRNKRRWHAFGHNEERLNELWTRVAEESEPETRLIKLGQLMHFVEDWEAHAGFGARLGHARATWVGKDPDSLGRSDARNRAMIQAGLVHLLKTCELMERPAAGTSDPDLALTKLLELIHEDGLMTDLFEQSDPKWRKMDARLGKKGRAILTENRRRVEEFIDQHLNQQSDKQVPSGFDPGSDENGLPPPLRMRFRKDGELKRELSGEVSRGGSDDFDLELWVEDARQVENGWEVLIEIHDAGPGDSESGAIEVFVADAHSEELLGEASTTTEALSSGQSRELKVLVPSSKSISEVVIGAVVDVDDLSATNNEGWFEPWDDPGPEPPSEQSRGGPLEEIHLFGEPRVLFLGAERPCALLRAYTSGGDSSEKLGAAEVELLDTEGTQLAAAAVQEPVWSAVDAADAERVVAQTVLCFRAQRSLCPSQDGKPLASLRVTLRSSWAMEESIEVPVQPAELRANLDGICGDAEPSR